MRGVQKRASIVLLVLLVTTFLFPAAALADCGADASSCRQCHEGQQQMPVNQSGQWHVDHAFGDFCAQCHGGDRSQPDLTASHQGMTPALAGTTACEECHMGDAQTKLAAYQQDQESKEPAPIAAASTLPPPGSNNGLFLIINAAVLLALGAMVWAMEKGPLAARFRRPPVALETVSGAEPQPNNPMARKAWSPYVAGAGLGLVAIGALWISKQPVGASGAFLISAGGLLKSLDLPLANGLYFKSINPPQISWQWMLVLGTIFGGFVSAIWSGDFRFEVTPALWRQIFGPRVWKRWAAIFLGGMILEYGASIAGGCTSGLAIAGTMQLSAAGLLFVGGLFTTGVVTARLLYRRDF